MKSLIKSTLFAAVLAGFAGSVQAYPTMTLDQLLQPGAFMIVGDKMFDHFGLNSGNMTASSISIQGIDASNPLFTGNFGIDIQGNFTQTGVGKIDGDLTYRVSAIGSGLISGIMQVVNATGAGTVWAATSIELVLDGTGNLLTPPVNLLNGAISGGVNLPSSEAFFAPPQSVLLINKDINIVVGTGGQFATITDIQQTFVQVPEPSTIALAAIGLAMCLGLRRRS